MKYKFKIQRAPVVTKFRVYFDKDTGKIHSITNKELDYDNFFEIPVQDIEDFLAGTRNITKHKVVFDVKQQNYKIVSNQESVIAYVDDHIFRINQVHDAQIVIVQNKQLNKWQISSSTHTKKRMQEVGARLEEILMFSITEKNNPNILYNHFYVSISDIVQNDHVEFDFVCQEEQLANAVSVYTNRKFDKYTHEVVDE